MLYKTFKITWESLYMNFKILIKYNKIEVFVNLRINMKKFLEFLI